VVGPFLFVELAGLHLPFVNKLFDAGSILLSSEPGEEFSATKLLPVKLRKIRYS
jgi:hypothetical protein